VFDSPASIKLRPPPPQQCTRSPNSTMDRLT
jgi:hypothetical protein